MTLTDFLLARIAEDEYDAKEFARHMYAAPRSLVEVEAKRRIVELHTPVDEEPDGWCNRCDGDGWPCGTMAALALPYADHPDYRQEWRP